MMSQQVSFASQITQHLDALVVAIDQGDASAQEAESDWFVEHTAESMLRQRREEMRELGASLVQAISQFQNRDPVPACAAAFVLLAKMLHVADNLPLPLAQARLANRNSITGQILSYAAGKHRVTVATLPSYIDATPEDIISAVELLHSEGLVSYVTIGGMHSLMLEDSAIHLLQSNS